VVPAATAEHSSMSERQGRSHVMARVVRLPNVTPREKWVERISNAWCEQVSSIFETGNLLEAAKVELTAQKGRGEWLTMIKGELPFGRSMVNKLMAIASNDNLRNADHGPHLPASWRTLYELTQLTAEQFAAGIKSGAINPKMERKHINELRGNKPKERKKKEIASSPVIGRRVIEDIDDWCFHFTEEISAALRTLSTQEKSQLLQYLKLSIEELAEGNT
jgi:hypothetical protein